MSPATAEQLAAHQERHAAFWAEHHRITGEVNDAWSEFSSARRAGEEVRAASAHHRYEVASEQLRALIAENPDAMRGPGAEAERRPQGDVLKPTPAAATLDFGGRLMTATERRPQGDVLTRRGGGDATGAPAAPAARAGAPSIPIVGELEAGTASVGELEADA